jgi:hypothetical protein
VFLRRFFLTRALGGGLVAALAASTIVYLFLPVLHVHELDPVRSLATWAGVDAGRPMYAALVGWALLLACAELVALLFAAVWDVIPPRTRPVAKSVILCGLIFLLLRLPLVASPAVLVFALALGVTYRPHPAPPPVTPVHAHPRVRRI